MIGVVHSLQLLDAHLDPKLDNCHYVDVQCPLGCLQILPKFKLCGFLKKW